MRVRGSELQGLFASVGHWQTPCYQGETKKGGSTEGGLKRIQETPGGGAKTSKVAAIMGADGHLRALSTKWHKIWTE